MKAQGMIVLGLLCIVMLVPAAEKNLSMEPLTVLEKYGTFALTDGSSYYKFSKNGQFSSGPLGMCGRTMGGTWKQGESQNHFVATVTLGWINGANIPRQYRRVVFYISSLKQKKTENANYEVSVGAPPSRQAFSGYFFIDELTPISELDSAHK